MAYSKNTVPGKEEAARSGPAAALGQEEVLRVTGLKTYFFTREGTAKAVDGVGFSLKKNETLGLVGESGCGKTVTCLSILGLVPPPGRIVGGRVLLGDEDLLSKTEKEMVKVRGRRITMILQDPMTSLNPVFTIGNQVAEAIRIHQRLKGRHLWEKTIEILRLVRIPAPEMRLGDYPHQMSGGMRQRVVGAAALSCRPEVLIADECTTSLDVTIQAQYLSLLKEVQERLHVAIIFITHDLGIVAKMCDRVAVMYAGRIVETAPMREIFHNALHPYTDALLKSVPRLEERQRWLATIEGQPPSLLNLPPGCSFAPRCSKADDRCLVQYPPEVRVGKDHTVSCWRTV
ncbi:MAG: ABC transporter ATP-binding protein [Deltaproteobacteria bacterium]|nr:ABC transporter ATP-binding protein [Deltaproteobacteria bacterium]MBW2121658.1 ABC transporter ATP-binding protein [Deltaproteobacteria bacterium]